MHKSTLFIVVLVLGAEPALAAEPAPASAVAAPFDIASVGDDILADAVAMSLPRLAANARLPTDQSAQSYLQQAGAGSQIAMDEWWAQAGTVLIFNNTLSMGQPVR